MSIVLQGSTSGSVTLQEPAVAGTTVLDLPATSGTLITTGSSGQSIPKAALPTGSVLQVVSTTKTDTFTTTSTTFTDITGLSVSITPTSASSKILVIYNFQASATSGEYTAGFQLVRNSTAICLGVAAGNRFAATNFNRSVNSVADQSWVMAMNFLDSPATTSATTYKVQAREGSGGTVAVGRTVADSDASVIARFPSTITVMEIAA
jgi:hypothetical protein